MIADMPLLVGLVLLGSLLLWYVLWAPLSSNPSAASRRRAGQVGEQRVQTMLRHLYHGTPAVVLHDVTLPDPVRGSVQIDHIILAPGGIFVLETKHWAGTILGDPTAAQWHQRRRDGRTRQYQNPLQQNQLHVHVVRTSLAHMLPRHLTVSEVYEVIHGLVVFTGSAQPIGTWPAGVGSLPWLHRQLTHATVPRLRPQDIQRCADHLNAHRLTPGARTDRRHRRAVQRRRSRL